MLVLSALLPAAAVAAKAARQSVHAIARPLAGLLRTLRHRREIVALADLDAHALKDIGLTRTDVHGALAVSIFDDPSHVLCDIAGAGHGQAARLAAATQKGVVMIRNMPKEA